MYYAQMRSGVGELVPCADPIVPFNPFKYTVGKGIGELMPGQFPIPNNPLRNVLVAQLMKPNCGNALGCAVAGMQGLGDLSSTLSELPNSISTWVSSQPWTTWAYVGGGAVVLFMLMGGGRPGYRAARSEALRKLKSQYPTRAAKVRRSVEAY
jgi:hypothetical protein